MWPMPPPRARSRASMPRPSGWRRHSGRGRSRWCCPRPPAARSPNSPPPASTPSRCGCRPPGGAVHSRGLRPAGGGAVGQPLRPRLADDRAARARRPARAHRPDHRRRRRRRSGLEFDHRRLSRPAGAAAARRARARRDRAGAAARSTRSPAATAADDGARRAPGQLASHYAPQARLRLEATRIRAGEALLAFGPRPAAGAELATVALNLSSRGDLIEAAANLFAHLRALDACGAATIAVMPVPRQASAMRSMTGWNGRLRRADTRVGRLACFVSWRSLSTNDLVRLFGSHDGKS